MTSNSTYYNGVKKCCSLMKRHLLTGEVGHSPVYTLAAERPRRPRFKPLEHTTEHNGALAFLWKRW